MKQEIFNLGAPEIKEWAPKRYACYPEKSLKI